jgi:hypothetical protein
LIEACRVHHPDIADFLPDEPRAVNLLRLPLSRNWARWAPDAVYLAAEVSR